jgi:hypothetical protein
VRSRFHALVAALGESGCRFVVIGVAGANYYAIAGSVLFATLDRVLFLPPDPANLLAVWQVCQQQGLELTVAGEELDQPRDTELAQRVVERRALTRASDGRGLEVDISLVMSGFDFDTIWRERRVFTVEAVEIPVARLVHIVDSKARTGRPKDRLFLETYKEALHDLLPHDSNQPGDRDE